MYLLIIHGSRYFEEKGVDKYLVFDSADENKELMKKYNNVFNGIRDKIKEITSYECDYEKDYMKIKFNSDYNLPLNKPLKFDNMIITIRSVVKDGKLYPQLYLQNDKIDISEWIESNKTNLSKEYDICHYWFFKNIGSEYEKYLCNGCHDLMHKAMSFNNVAIVYVKRIQNSFLVYE